jgi:membrane associated rhomboid family serine protease
MQLRIRYNAPVVLTISLLATLVLVVGSMFPLSKLAVMTSAPGVMAWNRPLDYLRLFTYVLGHSGWQHLLGNVMLILLIGPLLEEKHGSFRLLRMILVTALVTSLLNALLFDTGLRGASGVAFMFIVLASMVNMQGREIPLTFVLVLVLFLGSEAAAALRQNSVSEFAHIAGGACGAAFGLLSRRSAPRAA